MVDDFLSAHPWCDADHVRDLAAFAEIESIPYCSECHDWHHANEDHSEI